MTLQQNIRAVLDRFFTETRDDIKDAAAEKLSNLIADNRNPEIWVTRHAIPSNMHVMFEFFNNEEAAIEHNEYYKALGATREKLMLKTTFDVDEANVENN